MKSYWFVNRSKDFMYKSSLLFGRPLQQLQMFYHPSKRLHFLNSTKNKSQIELDDRSKSKSFRAKITFSPDKRHQNPQEIDKNNIKNQVKQSYLNSSTVKEFKSYLRSPNNTTTKLHSPQPIVHNLSSTNLRIASKNTLFPLNNISQTKNKQISLSKNQTTSVIKQNNLFLNSSIKMQVNKQKTSKDPPSFIRHRFSHTTTIADIQVIKQISKQSCFLVRHKKMSALFHMKMYPKKSLSNPCFFTQFKEYLKNTQITNRLIAKFMGFTSDQSNIYIFQQYLHGLEMSTIVRKKDYQFSESELGAKIYQILTVMSHLSKINHPHGPLTSNHIVYTLVLMYLNRTPANSKDKFQTTHTVYDPTITMTFGVQIITGQQLVPVTLLNQSKNIDQVFNSTPIAKCIQKGLKKLQDYHLSRELIQFLIASIWTVQHKQVKYQTLFNYEFIKIFRDDDIWMAKDKSE